MIRHIFMCTIKDGVSDELVEKKMAEMRAMKDGVPEIEAITVARNLGWAGPDNVVTMLVDLKDKAAFESLMASKAHTEVAAKADEAFRTDNFVLVQIEV